MNDIKSFFFDIFLIAIWTGFIFVDTSVEAFSGADCSAFGQRLTQCLASVNSLDDERLEVGPKNDGISQADNCSEATTSRRAAIQKTVAMSLAVVSSNPFLAVAYPGEVISNTEVDLDCLRDLPPLSDDSIRLYLCRHGQTENNRLRIVQGARVDPPINGNGKAQATNLGLALARAAPKPELFFSSSLLRAKMTAEIAANVESDGTVVTNSPSSASSSSSVTPRQLSALAEIDFGPVADGQPISAVQEKMMDSYTKWAMGNVDYRPDGGGDSGREVSLTNWLYLYWM